MKCIKKIKLLISVINFIFFNSLTSVNIAFFYPKTQVLTWAYFYREKKLNVGVKQMYFLIKLNKCHKPRYFSHLSPFLQRYTLKRKFLTLKRLFPWTFYASLLLDVYIADFSFSYFLFETHFQAVSFPLKVKLNKTKY